MRIPENLCMLLPKALKMRAIKHCELTWHVDGKLMPVSPAIKYLGLIFRQSGDMVFAFQRLLQNGNGAGFDRASK